MTPQEMALAHLMSSLGINQPAFDFQGQNTSLMPTQGTLYPTASQPNPYQNLLNPDSSVLPNPGFDIGQLAQMRPDLFAPQGGQAAPSQPSTPASRTEATLPGAIQNSAFYQMQQQMTPAELSLMRNQETGSPQESQAIAQASQRMQSDKETQQKLDLERERLAAVYSDKVQTAEEANANKDADRLQHQQASLAQYAGALNNVVEQKQRSVMQEVDKTKAAASKQLYDAATKMGVPVDQGAVDRAEQDAEAKFYNSPAGKMMLDDIAAQRKQLAALGEEALRNSQALAAANGIGGPAPNTAMQAEPAQGQVIDMSQNQSKKPTGPAKGPAQAPSQQDPFGVGDFNRMKESQKPHVATSKEPSSTPEDLKAQANKSAMSILLIGVHQGKDPKQIAKDAQKDPGIPDEIKKQIVALAERM